MSTNAIDQALRLLGKKRVMLQIHDPSFPGAADEDVGRGTPYGRAALDFARFVRSLGFTGIQLGPQGLTSRENPSPYDSTAFSRSFLSISFSALADDSEWSGLVDHRALDEALAAARSNAAAEPDAAADAGFGRTNHELAFDSQAHLCDLAYDRFCDLRERGELDTGELEEFARKHRFWLEADAIFHALAREYGTINWAEWSGPESEVDRHLYCAPPDLRGPAERRQAVLRERYAAMLDQYALVQYLAHRQHQRFHDLAGELGLALYADLQVGLSLRDRWRLQPLFLEGYLLGAPPSRTNSEGQPWGYPVLDPKHYHESPTEGVGTGTEYLGSRAEKLFTEFDGVRIDHPQGLVCPWLYRTDDPDPFHAVQNGARLFSSPSLPDHPDLAQYAIPEPDQLSDPNEVARHADEWVRELSDEQVERYTELLSVIVTTAERHGLDPRTIACETLSTQPYPLKRAMERYGLGRFRVTQKMNVTKPGDVYRTDNAVEADWVMMGNHDTRPIWARVKEWEQAEELSARAEYLARRLRPEDEAEAFAAELAANTGLLVHAYFADLLVSRAENAVVFFADLFGIEETYNAPGTVGPENWSLRVPRDYHARYAADTSSLRALNIPYALTLALRSPLAPEAPEGLLDELERAAGEPVASRRS
ncbi:MAG: 4-alpha-glucanotransferase [Spirochaetota bacterium]